jgi:hypothetical protein
MQLLRREQRLIRKEEDITGIIHRSAYLYIFLHKYGEAAFVLRHQPD